MKKTFIAVIIIIGTVFSASAQESKFTAGVNVGLPMGDIKDFYSINFGLDFAYNFNVAKNFDAGFGVGYAHYIGKKEDFFEVEDAGFVPVFATAKYLITESIFVGTDLGYGIGISPNGNNGGLFYQPKLGYITDEFDIFVGYKNISLDNLNYTTVNLGINYKI